MIKLNVKNSMIENHYTYNKNNNDDYDEEEEEEENSSTSSTSEKYNCNRKYNNYNNNNEEEYDDYQEEEEDDDDDNNQLNHDKEYNEYLKSFSLKKNSYCNNRTTESSDDSNDNDTIQNKIDYISLNDNSLVEKEDIYKNFSIKIESLEIYIHKNDTYPIYIERKDILKKRERNFLNDIIDDQLMISIESPNINLYINSIPLNKTMNKNITTLYATDSRNTNNTSNLCNKGTNLCKKNTQNETLHQNEREKNHLLTPMLLFYELLLYLYIYKDLMTEIDSLYEYRIPFYQLEKFKYFNLIKSYLDNFQEEEEQQQDQYSEVSDYYNNNNMNTSTSMDIQIEDDNGNYCDYSHVNQSFWSITIDEILQSSNMPYNHLDINIIIKPLQEF